jgi:hypothetical protein
MIGKDTTVVTRGMHFASQPGGLPLAVCHANTGKHLACREVAARTAEPPPHGVITKSGEGQFLTCPQRPGTGNSEGFEVLTADIMKSSTEYHLLGYNAV